MSLCATNGRKFHGGTVANSSTPDFRKYKKTEDLLSVGFLVHMYEAFTILKI